MKNLILVLVLSFLALTTSAKGLGNSNIQVVEEGSILFFESDAKNFVILNRNTEQTISLSNAVEVNSYICQQQSGFFVITYYISDNLERRVNFAK